MATEADKYDPLFQGLEEAMSCVEDGFSETGVKVIKSLKNGANELLEELEKQQRCLERIQQSCRGKEKLARQHVRRLERKERELAISKSIAESKQRTQLKKLNFTKWELMKARNAMYLYKRERARTGDKERLAELAEKMAGVQIVLDKLEYEYSRQNKSVQDASNKMTELASKHDQALHRTRQASELLEDRQVLSKQVDLALELTVKAVTLWQLCSTGFDNGHKRTDVISSIWSLYAQITSCHNMADICPTALPIQPGCPLCSQPMTRLICSHCEQHSETNAMIKLTELDYTDNGLEGALAVQNIAYDKKVLVRYTQDGWSHTRESLAEYSSSQGGRDCFRFELCFDLGQSRCLEFALCYQVNDTEYWDNNSGRNYSVSL